MPRPRGKRFVRFSPSVTYFKPRGIPLSELDEVDLNFEEVEALRLKNIEGLDQNQAAIMMKTSQSTFQRILSGAYNKMSDAVINGKAIKITNQKTKED